MGKLISKLNKSVEKNEVKNQDSASVDVVINKLYKPLSAFSWKNASPAEIHQTAIPHYAKRFPI